MARPVGSPAYLPNLVGRDNLQSANAALSTSGSAVRVAGPGVAGLLVQILTAPIALLVDAASFAFSALCLLAIRTPEPAPIAATRRPVWSEIHEGLYIILSSRLLRPLALSVCAYNFFAAVFVTVSMQFMVHDLRLEPAYIGAIMSSSGIGAVLGGLASRPVAQRFGVGPAIVGGALVLGLVHFVAPLAVGPGPFVAALLFGGWLISGIAQLIFAVNRQTVVQHLAPEHALGRVFASERFVIMAAVPLGSALAGFLGEWLGLRATLAIAAIGTTLGMASQLASPIRTLRTLPALAPDEVPDPRSPGTDAHGSSATISGSVQLRP